jgi:ABC-type oligopeptide transport system ATPase subunit
MSELTTRVVPMPPTTSHPQGHNLLLRDRVLVVIGANGSGKTRFGAWLDSKDIKLHHRVSAHRSLQFPESVQPTDFKEAERALLFGTTNEKQEALHRHHTRWQQNPATALLNDFEPLVRVLVSESFAVSDQYRVSMKAESKYVAPPKTRMDLVKEIWEAVLPDRELVFTGSRIETRNRKDNGLYHAKEMSDGERGIFHLIGEALSVPTKGLFVVDEPELHLHRAIQARLWDAIESARPDCTFVYITHDLGFAASRKDATKVWLREYTNEKWDWVEVPETDALPETLLLEVMGSRRPILFSEGDRTSLDYFIYGKVFPEYTVVSCGSCEHVIHSACSFAETPTLHENRCAGIVDNDGRTTSDIEKLNGLGIAVLPVALIENLFLTEPVVRISAEKLGHSPDEILLKIKDRVFELLKKNAVRVASNLTRQEMEAALRTFGAGEDGAEALSAAYKTACAASDPALIYTKWEKEIARVIEQKDYAAALRYYKIKGLPAEAGSVFGLKFQDQMMRWLRSKDAALFVAAFRSVIPSLPERAK